ncbi:bile acid:sodium symporter [Desulfosediminicola flagellatus]|uniref:bile acid:sodium symporter n=1 Tax=Desulfosediminicola flagellatus TaxID=2569541 RepID=UPI0010ABD4DD|nr:bile acid:sodium symporter [Desulfosediminicola flagellatus]
MSQFFRKNWFMLGLIGVATLAVGDISGITVSAGLWLKGHHGPDIVIMVIFFLSGLALNTRQIRTGISDYSGTFVALLLIFVSAPLVAILFCYLPLSSELLIGLLLVAAMPTTLSSGVVMTGSSGGNMAHALLITILANSLAVLTIPLTLAFLLSFTGDNRIIEIDQLPIMIKIATRVLLPLIAGIILRNKAGALVKPILPYISVLNQTSILFVVWMASCQGREAIVASLGSVIPVILVTFVYHLILLFIAIAATEVTTIGKSRRESVILMGCQKTLPLSIILQVSLFPEYGLALVVCVLHHITHLAMDAFLVQYLKTKK